jgi:hypothetical protein
MLEPKIEVITLRNTEKNMQFLVGVGESKAHREYHILRNESKIAIVTHYVWDSCDYCTADCDDGGVIDLE